MYPVKQSTALTVPVFAHDANGDAVTGMVDGGFTKRISKNGAAFGAMTVTITEMENGWYSVPLSTSHTDTLGLLSITFTNASCKQVNLQLRVTAKLIDDLNDVAATDIVSGGAINTTTGAVDNVTTVATTTTNTDMRGTDNALLAASAPTNFGDMAITVTTGEVTVGTNNDKTGYTASTVSDKTGYSISGTKTTLDALNDIAATAIVSGGAINTTTGAVDTVTAVTNRVTANSDQINGSADGANRLSKATQCNVFCTVGSASTTTSIVTSAMDPAAAAVDQFKGKIVTFDANTTTANLRGQSTDITGSTALGVLTVTALTDAPVSGDTFVIT